MQSPGAASQARRRFDRLRRLAGQKPPAQDGEFLDGVPLDKVLAAIDQEPGGDRCFGNPLV